MSGLLNDMMKIDGLNLVNTDEFGERVTYTPRNGTPCCINVVIDRNPPDAREGAQASRRPVMACWILNHPTKGRASIDTGGDTITTEKRFGGKKEVFAVQGPVTQDHGFWQVLLG